MLLIECAKVSKIVNRFFQLPKRPIRYADAANSLYIILLAVRNKQKIFSNSQLEIAKHRVYFIGFDPDKSRVQNLLFLIK